MQEYIDVSLYVTFPDHLDIPQTNGLWTECSMLVEAMIAGGSPRRPEAGRVP